MVLGLLIALALNSKVRGTTFARSAVFAPYVLSGVGVGLVWLFIFDPGYGVLAWILRGFGQQSPQWINDPQLSLVMVIMVYVWKNLGYCAVVYPRRAAVAAAGRDGGRLARRCRRFSPLHQHVAAAPLPHHVLPADHHHAQLTAGVRPHPDHDAPRRRHQHPHLRGVSAGLRRLQPRRLLCRDPVVLFVFLLVITVLQLRFIEKKVHYS